jgi:hypothetical protein
VNAPSAGGSTRFVEQWQDRKASADDRYLFGIGYGADANGLGSQGGPRSDAATNPVIYPFTGLGGVVIDKQVSGTRTYDINTDGVAHYGLYPDWIEDLRLQAGDEIVEDLARGSEAYLQMWERAQGVPGPGCPAPSALARLRDGMAPEEVLRAVGQPVRRASATFTYCVAGAADATLTFDASGRLVGDSVLPSTAPPSPPAPGGRLPATGGPFALWPLASAGLLALALALRRAAATRA